jgi:hypothetical protein
MPKKSSPFFGVSKCRGGSGWQVVMALDGKLRSLGVFGTEIEAATVVDSILWHAKGIRFLSALNLPWSADSPPPLVSETIPYLTDVPPDALSDTPSGLAYRTTVTKRIRATKLRLEADALEAQAAAELAELRESATPETLHCFI